MYEIIYPTYKNLPLQEKQQIEMVWLLLLLSSETALARISINLGLFAPATPALLDLLL